MSSPQHRRLFLHIGTHKTGTTSIQIALARQSAALRARDFVVYPLQSSSDLTVIGAADVANGFVRASLATPRRLKRSMPPQAMIVQAFEDWLAACLFPNIIPSAEACCFCATPTERIALTDCFGRAGLDVTVIVAFRDVAQWRASYQEQLQSMGVLPLMRDLPDSDRADADWYFDKDAIRRFWRSVGDVEEIDYGGAVAAEGTILPAFFRSLGLAGLEPSDVGWHNRTVPAPGLA